MRCISPLSIKDPSLGGSSRLTVPCGKCGMCRANRRTEWSFRILKEFEESTSATFLTLTYQESKIPKLKGKQSLRKKDWQLFMKRLRKKTKNKIRYYAVGEYGTKSNRPHYHAIIFGLGNKPHKSVLQSWADGNKTPLGHSYIGNVTHASIHYVTKYHVNYHTKKEWEEKGKITEPEFAVMSRNPGIGANWIQQNIKWFKQNKNLYVINNGFKQRLPRYYKEKVYNRIEKDLMSLKSIREADRLYLEELIRLEKLGYKKPHLEYEERMYFQSKKVKDKANKNDRL